MRQLTLNKAFQILEDAGAPQTLMDRIELNNRINTYFWVIGIIMLTL